MPLLPSRTVFLLIVAVGALAALVISRGPSEDTPQHPVELQIPPPLASTLPPTRDTSKVCSAGVQSSQGARSLAAVGKDSQPTPTVPSLAVVDSQVVLRLPPMMRAVMLACDPTFRPWDLNNYEAWILDGRTLALSERQMPSALIGDFNGDGKLDLVADGTDTANVVMLVLVSQTDRYELIYLRKEPFVRNELLGRLEDYLHLVSPGDIRIPVHDVGERDLLHLTTEAFELIADDKGSALCYYNHGHFVWATTGD
jgi:hypothetical protein